MPGGAEGPRLSDRAPYTKPGLSSRDLLPYSLKTETGNPAGPHPVGGPRGAAEASASFWWPQVSLGLWLQPSSLYIRSLQLLLSPVCLSPLPSPIKTRVIGSGPPDLIPNDFLSRSLP